MDFYPCTFESIFCVPSLTNVFLVYLCNKADSPGTIYAMKVVSKNHLARKNLLAEITHEKDIMATTCFQYIVRLRYCLQVNFIVKLRYFIRAVFNSVGTSVHDFLNRELYMIWKPRNATNWEHSIFFNYWTNICLIGHWKLVFYWC